MLGKASSPGEEEHAWPHRTPQEGRQSTDLRVVALRVGYSMSTKQLPAAALFLGKPQRSEADLHPRQGQARTA